MGKKTLDTRKIFVKIFIGIPFGLIGILLIAMMVSSGIGQRKFDNVQTMLTKDGLQIVTETGSDSAGSSWEIKLYGDAVGLTGEEKVSRGFFTATQTKKIYRLKAKHAGRTVAVVFSKSGGSNYSGAEVFVTDADEDLNISYTSHKADLLMIDTGGKTAHEVPLCGEYTNDKAERGESLPMTESKGTEYHIDPQTGRIDIFYGGKDGVVFMPDKALMPYYRELFDAET